MVFTPNARSSYNLTHEYKYGSGSGSTSERHLVFDLANSLPNLRYSNEIDNSSMQLKFDQAMRDTVIFAKNVKLPFTTNNTASDAPWVLTGGSYNGPRPCHHFSKFL
ncbi:hypothetical protein COCMIDRAFT_30853 [Bipolaris oryzae ATCC 44560]|uniref:Uncharacterized protein n=1 Tax=Bipolaris oryzae ATCC 44560 TaxID=930090 RepID=W6YXB3_COCMI|nr:uncharacterized protein COCMIDRAFT_30853 [Bipolaris oryzae ATCC 44560]EUC40164.1 hypothetical protein COCMIDRAFT_30853 [Bipolaris oryzae ATCC 44560]